MQADALVFDAYGTLFDVHAVVARCDQFWPGRGGALSQLWRAKQLEYTWQRALMRRYVPFSAVTREALEYACESMGLALAALKAGGRKLAILSNGSPDMLEPQVAHHGLGGTFDAVLSVDGPKTFKPAPEVYRYAVDRLGVAAGRIGFVSSNCWDALGAKSFGFLVWWIRRSGAPVDRLGFNPDGTLGGLGELPALLRS